MSFQLIWMPHSVHFFSELICIFSTIDFMDSQNLIFWNHHIFVLWVILLVMFMRLPTWFWVLPIQVKVSLQQTFASTKMIPISYSPGLARFFPCVHFHIRALSLSDSYIWALFQFALSVLQQERFHKVCANYWGHIIILTLDFRSSSAKDFHHFDMLTRMMFSCPEWPGCFG